MRNRPLIWSLLAVLIVATLSYFFIKTQVTMDEGNKQPNVSATPVDLSLTIKNNFDQGNFQAAIAAVDSGLSSNPQDVELLLQKATILAQQASLQFKEVELGNQAEAYIKKVLEINPSNASAWELLGYIYEIQQRYPEAHQAYDKAISINPGVASTLAQKGHAYDLEGKLSEAKSLYSQALSIDPNNIKALSGLGRLSAISGNKDEASKYFSLVANQSTNAREKAEAYFALGSISQKSKYAQATEDFMRKSIETDKTFASGYVGLASETFKKTFEVASNTDASSKLLKESFSNIQTAIDINPNQASAFFQMALQFKILGDNGKLQIVLKDLPKIIDSDITLSKNEKEKMKDSVQLLQK